MNRNKERRSRAAALFALALGALAIFALPAVASAKDSNGDHIPDRWEKRHDLSLSVNQAGRDQDHDHLRNMAEFRAGDNPRDNDTDNDGVMDGQENAGTIASFDAATGRLVIDLFGTDTVSGLVTEQTTIKCEGAPSAPVASRSSDGESGNDNSGQGSEPGDDNGGQGEEPGDDNGGNGEEPGDDNGGDNSGPGSGNSGPSGHDDNGMSSTCTVAALVPGAVVQQADLQIEHGTATFDEVELAHSN